MDQLGGDLMPTLARIAPHIDSLVVALTTIASDPALLRSVQRLDDIMANLEVSTKNLNAAMAGVPALVNTANGTVTNVKGDLCQSHSDPGGSRGGVRGSQDNAS